MTIGYVLDDTLDKPDGVQQAVIAIAEHMRSLGHDVHYVVPETFRTDLKNVHTVAKIVNFRFNGNSTRTPIFAKKCRIKQLFSDVDFDVLHVQMPYSPLMAARIIKLAKPKTKIIGTFHILPYNRIAKIGTKILGLWLSKNKRRFGKAYAVSQPALDFMREDFGLDGEVMPNPVDYKFFHRKTANKSKEQIKKLVFVGRFDKRKGVKQLVKAYEKLSPVIRETTKLTMCGKGPLRNELMAYSDARNLGIDFPGFISDEQKVTYLEGADIAIFPATGGESFGIVLTEAMAAGSGITLGGNNPGYSSVLHDWPDVLFNANNNQEFVKVLTRFIENDKERLSIGKLQHEAVKRYDIKVVANRLLSEAYRLH